jgi:hypothetical protein
MPKTCLSVIVSSSDEHYFITLNQDRSGICCVPKIFCKLTNWSHFDRRFGFNKRVANKNVVLIGVDKHFSKQINSSPRMLITRDIY